MPPRSRPVPAYRQRKGYDQALVTLRDAVTKKARDYWLGPFNTPQSRELYHRVIADWEAGGRRLPEPPRSANSGLVRVPGTSLDAAAPAELTVLELCAKYVGATAREFGAQDQGNLKAAIRVLVQLGGTGVAAQFGPNRLRQVRDAMIVGTTESAHPRRPWSRRYVNTQVQRIVRMFKWAAAREILPASVYQQLQTIEPLRRGRSLARETEPIKPVADALVDAIQPHVSRQVWALVELQRLTGARPGELFALRPMDLHREQGGGEGGEGGEVWTYSPDDHKTAYRGRKRIIYLGPKAQEVLKPFLKGRGADEPLFSPAEAEAERRAKMHKRRVTPLSCGNRPGTNRTEKPRKQPGGTYTTASYSKAILHGCDKAFPLPAELRRLRVPGNPSTRRETLAEWRARVGEKKWPQIAAWRKAHRWHPYQLRHSAATNIRRQFGLEAAQIALGHSSALVTEAVYAERDMTKAVDVMRRFG